MTAATDNGIIDTFDPDSVQVLRDPVGSVEIARQAGYDAGYNEGLAQARQDVTNATEDANKRVRRALAALAQAVDAFDERQTVALADVEDAVVAAAFEIARKVVQRELAVAEDPGADAIARAMALLPNRGDVIARLHPDDVATLNMDRLASMSRTVQLYADPSIELGGCIVEVGDMRIDSQLSTAFDHVKQALSIDPALLTNEPLIDEDVQTARSEAATEASNTPVEPGES
jgi:flagellar assembly protein FliH